MLKNSIKLRRILVFIGVISLMTILSGDSRIYAQQCNCPSGYEIANKSCPLGHCSACNCTHVNCGGGDTYNPPYPCWRTPTGMICALGTSCSTSCLHCGNYQCREIVPPCDPVDCTCGSGCKAGTTSTNTGPYCSNPTTHSPCSDGCGVTWDCPTTQCWDNETNSTPPTPSDIQLNVGPVRNSLSTSNVLRTLIPLPLASESAAMSVPGYSHPGAGASFYSFLANNTGVLARDPSWINFSTSPVRSEDVYVSETSSNSVPFNPAIISTDPEGLNRVLYSEAQGELRARNIARDRCSENRRSSGERIGYYLVNTLPVVNSITKDHGEAMVSTGQATGCASLNYTGRQAQNPIGYTIEYEDLNQSTYRDIEALYVWFAHSSVGGNPPNISAISTSGDNNGSADNSFGFMIRRENATWNGVPNVAGQIGNVGGAWDLGRIYVSSLSGGNWSLLKIGAGGSTVILGPNRREMVRISQISLVENANRVTLNFRIEFLSSDDSSVDMVADGQYRVRAGVSDHHSFLPMGGSSLRRQPVWDGLNRSWNIDLTRPEAVLGDLGIAGAQTLQFASEGIDLTSGINLLIGDAYRVDLDDYSIHSQISKISPPPVRSAYDAPVWPTDPALRYVDQLYNTTNDALWFSGSGNQQQMIIDIGDNEGGGYQFYATTFDNACNHSLPNIDSYVTITNLGVPWMMTKGGSFYSEGGTNVPVRDFLADPAGISFKPYDSYNDYFGFTRSQTQLSTEFLGVGSGSFGTVVSRGPNEEPLFFRTLLYGDNINQKNTWFERLHKDHVRTRVKRPDDFTVVPSDEFRMYLNGGARSMEGLRVGANSVVVEYPTDLTIASGFECDNKTLIMVGSATQPADLVIDPSMTRSGDVLNGCIVIVSGNITIGEGNHASAGHNEPHYDLLEGIFFAENVVDILEGDIGDTISARDGLKVHGAIYGMGSSGGNGVIPRRTLKLVDNVNYPATVVHHDPRYLELVKYFFGGVNYTYIRETGWNP
jgi:hypothetical protein